MTTDEKLDQLGRLVQGALQREIALTAVVRAQQDYLYYLLEKNPPPGWSKETLAKMVNQSIAAHHEELLIQLEDCNETLAAVLAEEEPPTV